MEFTRISNLLTRSVISWCDVHARPADALYRGDGPIVALVPMPLARWGSYSDSSVAMRAECESIEAHFAVSETVGSTVVQVGFSGHAAVDGVSMHVRLPLTLSARAVAGQWSDSEALEHLDGWLRFWEDTYRWDSPTWLNDLRAAHEVATADYFPDDGAYFAVRTQLVAEAFERYFASDTGRAIASLVAGDADADQIIDSFDGSLATGEGSAAAHDWLAVLDASDEWQETYIVEEPGSDVFIRCERIAPLVVDHYRAHGRLPWGL